MYHGFVMGLAPLDYSIPSCSMTPVQCTGYSHLTNNAMDIVQQEPVTALAVSSCSYLVLVGSLSCYSDLL